MTWKQIAFIFVSLISFSAYAHIQQGTSLDTIIVKSNQPRFTIQLSSNPSTGYTWVLSQYDPALIQPIEHTFKQSQQKLMGAAGMEWWTFKVQPAAFLQPRVTIIRMMYARPWQGGGVGTQKMFRIKTVKE